MTVTINGSGTMTGLAVGGLNDNIITPAELSTGAPSWDSSGNLSFNSGYGSAATAYGCRAWVNFNGTGTVAIRASGNVSSVTDLGTGYYQLNFSTAMPDGNYAAVALSGWQNNSWGLCTNGISSPQLSTSYKVNTIDNGGNPNDNVYVSVAIFR